jgi:hypothetical protein
MSRIRNSPKGEGLPTLPLTAVMVSLVLLPGCSDQQTASTVEPVRTVDESYQPDIPDPAFQEGAGPAVCMDAAHNNFHTVAGTYRPFADVLRRDGFRVWETDQPVGPGSLSECDVFVIADAQPPARRGAPPTFSEVEVNTLHDWVREGGALFIITDHMPDPGPIRELAASFGLEVNDGYVMEGGPGAGRRPTLFRMDAGTIVPDPLTLEMESDGAIQQIATFTGSAFRSLPGSGGPGVGGHFRPLLVFGPGLESWMPEEYYGFTDRTPRIDVEGWYQGGVSEWGRGRLAFFSEAAMFTAQVFENGAVRVGMNAPEAADNLRLLRRVMGWLAGVVE